jgi:hypothetical protein
MLPVDTMRFECDECLLVFELSVIRCVELDAPVPDVEVACCPFCRSPAVTELRAVDNTPVSVPVDRRG